MATEFEYTIRGQQVITKKQLTDAEIDEIAASLPKTGGITPKELSRVFQRNRPQDTGASTTDYLADVTKRAVANVVPQVMRAVGGMEASMQMPSTQPSLTQQIEQQFIKPVQQRSQQALGYQQTPPPDSLSRLVGAGIESSLDPVSIVSGPGGIVRRVLGGFVPGVTAEFGGQVGQNVAGDEGQIIGALTGGVSGGFLQAGGTYGAVKAGTPLVKKGYALSKGAVDRVRGAVPEEEIARQADSTVNAIFQAASEADPRIADVIAKSQQISATTGVQLPASAILNNNPVIADLIRNLSTRDPKFRSQYGSQFEQAMDALSGRATRLFGDPTQANFILQQTLKNIPLDKVQQRRLDAINQQIAKSSTFKVEDPEALGTRVAKLVEKQEKEARELTQPFYKAAFDYAEQNNINLPATGVEDIYRFVNDTRAADKFFSFPSIWNKITKPPSERNPGGFGPVKDEAGNLVFKDASIADIDSLKREINLQIRKTKDDPASQRLLSSLKNSFEDTISNVSEDFSRLYKAADAAYLERVGLPFNQEAIKQIDRAKFNESVLPVITKNKSALSQFVDATGEEGRDLAMKAFLTDFDRVAVKDGVIDPKVARKWLKENSGELVVLGDKADVIRKAVTDVTELNAQKVRINNAFTEARKGNLLQLEGKTAQDIINNLYSNPANVDRFLRTHGSNIDTLNAVRSFMLDDILSAQNPVEALTDRTRKATYDKVFGPTYAKNVENLAEAARRLSVNPADVKFNVEKVPKTPVEESLGFTPESAFSKARDRFTSAPYVAAALLSKFWAKQTAAATDEKLKALLLDPQATRILAKSFKPRADGSIDTTAAKDLLNLAAKAGFDWATLARDDTIAGAARAIPAVQAGMPEEMQ
jgi:hypothetical protein